MIYRPLCAVTEGPLYFGQGIGKTMRERAARRFVHTEYGKKDARRSSKAFSAYRVWQKRCVMKD
jgi:hypothetical protein